MLEVLPLGLGERLVPYAEGLELQRTVHDEVARGERPNTLILLEHEPVYTAGKRTEDDERPTDGTPVVDVDRGGKITWHGPGQLVGYPIVRLSEPVDVVGFVRSLESFLIRVLEEHGVSGQRVDGRSGVWLPRGLTHDKIAAIGIRVASGTSMHGFALNCNNSLDAYSSIIACGIRDAGVTTMSRVTGKQISPMDVLETVVQSFSKEFEVAHELS